MLELSDKYNIYLVDLQQFFKFFLFLFFFHELQNLIALKYLAMIHIFNSLMQLFNNTKITSIIFSLHIVFRTIENFISHYYINIIYFRC